MNFSWLIILSLLFITIIILLIFILLRTKQSSSNLELNEIKAQLDIIASTGTQSQEAVTNAISNQQARLNDSMTNLSDRLNLRLNEQTTKTSKELSSMHERLAVIDAAQYLSYRSKFLDCKIYSLIIKQEVVSVKSN